MMKGMKEYLAQPQEQAPELVFLPDVNNDKPLDLSDGKDQHIKYFPLWNRDDQVQEYEGEWNYDISLGYDMPLQQLPMRSFVSEPMATTQRCISTPTCGMKTGSAAASSM